MSDTVLVIEDEATILYALQSKLRVEGFNVLTAEDGEAALETLVGVSPDVIILDILLPKVDGWGVLKKIKEDESLKKIPVLIITNLTDKQSREKGVSFGAADYLVKVDYNIDEIVEKVRKVVADKK